MLDYPIHRESPLVLGLKLLQNLFDENEVIETSDFYWNLLGTDNDMPNFWWKHTNIQVEWYNDDPGRGTFSNYENVRSDDVINLIMLVRESYDLKDK